MLSRRALLASVGGIAAGAVAGVAEAKPRRCRVPNPTVKCTNGTPTSGDAQFFDTAAWLWNPIPASPTLDSNSANMISQFQTGQHIVNLYDYSVALRHQNQITAGTPRLTPTITNYPDWGDPTLRGQPVPFPNDLALPAGTDGHYGVADPTTSKVYNLWQTAFTPGVSASCGFGAMVDLHGDGRETSGSSTGAGLSCYAAPIRQSELVAGVIPHAIVFSSNMTMPTTFHYPATKTDGSNLSGASNPIAEGKRLQLDPSINVAAISGILPGELAIAKCLQQYGAYCIDNGGARAAFPVEHSTSTTINNNAGFEWDYFDLTHIPWASMRVLNAWNGA